MRVCMLCPFRAHVRPMLCVQPERWRETMMERALERQAWRFKDSCMQRSASPNSWLSPQAGTRSGALRGSAARVSAPLPLILGVPAALFLFLGFGTNTLLALLATIVLQWGLWLLWRPGESPILLFIFCYQWLQASTTIFLANWRGIDINLTAVSAGWGSYKVYGVDIWLATLLSLLGLVALALGMRLGAGPQRPQIAALVRNDLLRHRAQVLVLCLCCRFVDRHFCGVFCPLRSWPEPALAGFGEP